MVSSCHSNFCMVQGHLHPCTTQKMPYIDLNKIYLASEQCKMTAQKKNHPVEFQLFPVHCLVVRPLMVPQQPVSAQISPYTGDIYVYTSFLLFHCLHL